MSIKQAIEALEGLDEAYCRAGAPLTRDERTEDRKRLIKARAALAALRSMPTTLGKGITRDDTVHGEEYFTRGQVESVLRSMPAEPVAWQARCFFPDRGDTEWGGWAPIYMDNLHIWQRRVKEMPSNYELRALFATPHTEAVRMSEADKEEWAVLPLSAEILHLDDDMLQAVLIEIRANVRAARRLMTNGSTARMTVAQIEALFQQAADADEEVHIRFARAVEQATSARLGVTLTSPERER